MDAPTSLIPLLVAASNEYRPISEVLAYMSIVVGGDAGPSMPERDNFKSNNIDLNEAVTIPAVTSK